MQSKQSHPEAVTAVIRHRQRASWATVSAYLLGISGIVLATVTLTMFMLFKSAVATQISQLHQEVVTAQQAQTQAAGTVSGLSSRIHGLDSTVTAMGALLSSFSSTCQTDLTGPNGPAAFDFLCKPG